jgi:FkbM family methyltransferase
MMPLVTIREHTFFSLNLNSESIIVDAGANIGDFSRECARRFGCMPYALEPNPVSAAQITNAHVFVDALGAETRTAEFFIGPESQGCSLLPIPDHTTSRWVSVIALKDFLAEQRLESVDLLKLDIEGAELELLPTLTNPTNIAQITVEFHDFMHPEQRQQVMRTIQHMKAIGFRCFNFTSPGNYDVLFVNPRLLRLPLRSAIRAHVRIAARYCRRRLPFPADDAISSEDQE